jgi:hypothetical protein
MCVRRVRLPHPNSTTFSDNGVKKWRGLWVGGHVQVAGLRSATAPLKAKMIGDEAAAAK